MLKITEVAYTGYPVTDMARARAFYEGVLGLAANVLHPGWVEYELGPHTVAISNMSPEWKPSSSGPSLAFEVDDFPAAITHLKAAGVQFVLEPFESPVCHMAAIQDPDGNGLLIHKRKPGHS